MSAWLESALAQAQTVNDWLQPKRDASLALLKIQKWPTRKTEAWKYTSLYALDQTTFIQQAANEAIKADAIADLDAIELLFVNGRLQNKVADLPEGLSIVALADASVEQQAWASEAFTSVKPSHHLFGLVNDVLAVEGLLIDVAVGAQIEQLIRIVSVVTDVNQSHQRVLVRVGEKASLKVMEQAAGNAAGFNTSVAEYDVAAEASLEHYRFALQTGESMGVAGCHFNLADKSQLNSSLVGFGSQMSRLDVDVNHNGEHAFAKINAIYLLDGSEHFDLHTTVEHVAANGTTEENIRGIVADKARAIFNGRIHIHRDAQKTLAELNNRNLLLSRQAEINTKPELEIYADDVRCAHGATIAEIDKKALYYLQSRGVSRAQAQVMLNFGFINELVDQMPNEILAEWLRPQLRARFSAMEVK